MYYFYVKWDEFEQLFYMTHIDNLESIIARGILSHSAAQKMSHKRIDMLQVQERRATKRVPGASNSVS
jgi:hypothetical protein